MVFYAAVRRSLHTLTLIGVSLFLSLALDAPVQWLAGRLPGPIKGSRGFATGVSIVVVLLILGGFLWTVVPPLVNQTSSFIRNVPDLVQQVGGQNSSLGAFVRDHNLQGEVNKLSQQLSSRVGDIGGTAITTITLIGSSLFSTLAVVALTVMMLAEGPRWGRILGQLVPSRHSDRTARLIHDMQRVIRGYVNGQVLLAAIASVLIVPMLFILHISNPLALMVIIFICGLIPMVGHTIGAVIVTCVALFDSVTAAIIILALLRFLPADRRTTGAAMRFAIALKERRCRNVCLLLAQANFGVLLALWSYQFPYAVAAGAFRSSGGLEKVADLFER